MTALAAEFFTLDEVNRLKIIQDVIDRRLTTQMAAQRLGISDRQCRRLLARYREDGPLGMTSRRRGKSSNNQLPPGLAAYALNIIRERYNDFGPTLACEKLSEVHGVHLSKETVRKLMAQASLWVPRKQRAPKIQQPRYRRACAGELIQIDGCDHHWFENRGPKCTALVYVDDATSRLMQLRFVKSESTFTYFEATRGYIEKHGKPLALYSDKASVFRINNKNATGGDGETQFGRAMHELNIQTICAETSAAKGRVVDNKRLGRALEMAQLVQAERDNNRSQSVPSGDGPSRRRKAPTTKKSQRSLDQDDMFNALVKLQSRTEEIFGKKQI